MHAARRGSVKKRLLRSLLFSQMRSKDVREMLRKGNNTRNGVSEKEFIRNVSQMCQNDMDNRSSEIEQNQVIENDCGKQSNIPGGENVAVPSNSEKVIEKMQMTIYVSWRKMRKYRSC